MNCGDAIIRKKFPDLNMSGIWLQIAEEFKNKSDYVKHLNFQYIVGNFRMLRKKPLKTCKCVTESLHCSPEAIIRFLISCCLFCAQRVSILCDSMDSSPPGSSIHGISQARILEWIVISLSRGSSWPRDWTRVSHIVRWILYCWATREALNE